MLDTPLPKSDRGGSEPAQTTPEPPDRGRGARGKRAISRCKGCPERARGLKGGPYW